MPQSPSLYTIGNIATYITEQFGDVASVQIDTAKIIRWTNLAILEVITKDPKASRGTYTQNSVKDQQTYTYPARSQTIFGIKWDNTMLGRVAFENAMEQLGASFVNVKGDPQYWADWENTFLLYPTPSSVKTITVYATVKPPDVTSLSDIFPLADMYYAPVLSYVLAKAQELDEDYQAAAATRTLFEDSLKQTYNRPDASVGQNALLDDPDDYYYGDYA